jgi:hypothetical protein
MGSSSVNGNFTIMGPDDEPITALRYTVAIKVAMLSSFLNIKKNVSM